MQHRLHQIGRQWTLCCTAGHIGRPTWNPPRVPPGSPTGPPRVPHAQEPQEPHGLRARVPQAGPRQAPGQASDGADSSHKEDDFRGN